MKTPSKKTIIPTALTMLSLALFLGAISVNVAYALIYSTITWTTVLASGAHATMAWNGTPLAISTESYASNPLASAWICAGYIDPATNIPHCTDIYGGKPKPGLSYSNTNNYATVNSYYKNDEVSQQTLTNVDTGTYN